MKQGRRCDPRKWHWPSWRQSVSERPIAPWDSTVDTTLCATPWFLDRPRCWHGTSI